MTSSSGENSEEHNNEDVDSSEGEDNDSSSDEQSESSDNDGGLGEKNFSGLGGGGGFADALQKILKKPLDAKSPGSAILSKRKTPNMKLIEQELKEEKARKRARETKKDKDMIGLEIPSYKTLNYERQLKRVATRGVVSLFNAVKSAQSVTNNIGNNSSSSDKSLSKDKFFDMLSEGANGSGENSSSSSTNKSTKTNKSDLQKKGSVNKTDWLDDKFMIGAKMRNWDKDSDDSDDDQEGGIDEEVEIED